MADGQIIYQVRVDSSHVASDLGQATEQINSGALVIGETMSALSFSLSDAISSVLSPKTLGVPSFLKNVTGIADGLSTAASLAAESMAVLSENILNAVRIDLPEVDSLFDMLAPIKPSSSAQAEKGGAKKSGGILSSVPSYRSGTPYINKDEFAFLHKGEAVLTAAQNETLSRLGGVDAISSLQQKAPEPVVVQSKAPDVTLPEQNINVTVELDGRRVARAVANATNDMNRQLNTRIVK